MRDMAQEHAMFAAIAKRDSEARSAGGAWKLYLPLPNSRLMRLHWSYGTEAEAKVALSTMFPAIQKRAVIRMEA
jgi:hypothetical protein